jgi:hypothetical protein
MKIVIFAADVYYLVLTAQWVDHPGPGITNCKP